MLFGEFPAHQPTVDERKFTLHPSKCNTKIFIANHAKINEYNQQENKYVDFETMSLLILIYYLVRLIQLKKGFSFCTCSALWIKLSIHIILKSKIEYDYA